MIVYLARDIPPFVMYCVNGKPRSSLLIESTDSMIHVCMGVWKCVSMDLWRYCYMDVWVYKCIPVWGMAIQRNGYIAM